VEQRQAAEVVAAVVAEVAAEDEDVVEVDADGDGVSRRRDEDARTTKKNIIIESILTGGRRRHVQIEKVKGRELCSLKKPEIDHVQQGPLLDWFYFVAWHARLRSMRGRLEQWVSVNKRRIKLSMAKCKLIPCQYIFY
jgi:hypothetical protein